MSILSVNDTNTRKNNRTISNISPTIFTRNPEWISNPLSSSEEKVVALLALYPNDINTIALTAITSSGTFNVNWGDGTSTNGTASNTKVNKAYDYASISQTPTSDGYKQVIITITPAVAGALQYADFQQLNTNVYVNYAAYNYLEIKASGPNFLRLYALGGVTADTLGSVLYPMLENVEIINGSIAGENHNNMFQTCCPALKRYYFKSRTDMAATSNDQWTRSFYNCYSLVSFELISPNGGKFKPYSMYNTFYENHQLANLPYLDFSGLASITNPLFTNCTNIYKLNQLVFSSALTTAFTFSTGSTALKELDIVNNSIRTISITETSIQFIELTYGSTGQFNVSGCSKLSRAKLNISNAATNLSSCLSSCTNLKIVEIVSTGSGNITTMSSAFSNCKSLEKIIGNFTTTGCTAFNGSFSGVKMNRLPAMDYSSAASLPQLEYLTVFPETTTTYSSTISTISFGAISRIGSIPSVKITNVTNNNASYLLNLSSMLCYGMTQNLLLSQTKLNKAALNTVIDNLGNGASARTLTLTNSLGAVLNPIYTRTSTITSGSTTVSITDTSNFVVGTQVTGTGISDSRAVTFQDVGNTVTLNNHGIANGKPVGFISITTTTGISTYNIYYVINATTNTFQLSTTVGGSAIELVNDGSGNIRYQTLITNIVPNTSVTIDVPASSSGSVSLAYRNLNTQIAVLKGFTTITG